jgi:hypothetical protein
LEQQPWPRPSAPATIHTTTEISDDHRHGEDEDDHPHKKSVLQKVKDKAKKLIKKKKKPSHGRGDDHREEDHHHFDEEEEEEDTEEEEEEEGEAGHLNPPDFHSRPCKKFSNSPLCFYNSLIVLMLFSVFSSCSGRCIGCIAWVECIFCSNFVKWLSAGQGPGSTKDWSPMDVPRSECGRRCCK